MRRVNIRLILANPELRRELLMASIIAIQAIEEIETTYEQASLAYDAVIRSKTKQN